MERVKKMEPPCSYKLFTEQKLWLREEARKEGHNSEGAILRKVLDWAMKRSKTATNGS